MLLKDPYMNQNRQSLCQVAEKEVLDKFDAFPIVRTGTDDIVGINIAGWTISTQSSSIGNESELNLMNATIEDSIDNTRRLILPEIVFSRAFVSLKYTGKKVSPQSQKNGKNESDGGEPSHVEIKFSAQDALEEWAKSHASLDTNENGNDTSSSGSEYTGVSVIKTVDAKLWEERRKGSSIGISSKLFGQGAAGAALQNYSSEFNYDWTYSSPFSCSIVNFLSEPVECKYSGIERNMNLLTDQTLPILYFDDIFLYEDDMHDNGYVSLRCKIRVMPTCFFILLSLFVRVDHVLIRQRESRLFCIFDIDKNHGDNGDNSNEKGNDHVRIYRDICWKECPWEKLGDMNLPSQIGSWRIEEEGGVQSMQQRRKIEGMLRKLPTMRLPKGIDSHSYFSFPRYYK